MEEENEEVSKSAKEKKSAYLGRLRPPKRAKSAYVCYSHEVYSEVRRQLGSTASQPEIFSTIANQWRNMSPAEKVPYVQKVYYLFYYQ